MLRNSQPLTWSPNGVTDSRDSSQAPKGSMAQLANLIPDPSTAQLWQCRPAITRLTNFPLFITPGFISAFHIAGDLGFGLIASGRTPGFDEPFCYNFVTQAFITVSGITGANVPASPQTSGDWTPPTMDIVGSKVVVTHPGFAATVNMFGWFDISNPAAPAWAAGTTTGAVVIATVPSFVAQFNGRAYFIVNTLSQPATVFSDPLNATVVTNASQVLTYDDSVKLTALGQLRLWNQSGGIIQGLIVFKDVDNMYQVTGDSALGTLTRNALNVATGTLSPLAIAATSKGLGFISPDGLRIIDFQGNVSPPLGQDGKGVSLPFIYSTVFSRITMSAGGDLVRITTQNSQASGSPFQEWWYDLTRNCWSGPHTSAFSLLQPYRNTFIGAPQRYIGSLWQSDGMQTPISSFTETLDTTTRALLHFEGLNAGVIFPDDAPTPHQWTPVGAAQTSTAVKKFGTASYLGVLGAQVTTPAVAALAPLGFDFCFEGFFNCTVAGGTDQCIGGQVDAGFTAAGSAWDLSRQGATNCIRFEWMVGAAFLSITSTTAFTDVLNPGFHHWAAYRIGLTIYLAIDGHIEASGLATGALNNSAALIGWGGAGSNATLRWIGNLDEVRMTIGRAVYPAVDFAAPTQPFSFLDATVMAWVYRPSFFPDIQQMVNVSVSQTLLHCAIAANTSLAVSFVDPNEQVLDSVNVGIQGVPGIWGIMVWGSGLWGAPGTALTPRQIPWTHPIVFAKGAIVVTGPSNSVTQLGMLHMRYKILKYLANLGAVG